MWLIILKVLNIEKKQSALDIEVQADGNEAETAPVNQPVELLYDLEWLAIQKLLTSKMPIGQYETHFFSSTNGR